MSYKILTFEQANNLLKDGLAKEVRSIDYNQCTVYKVLDGKLLVKPLHPFANSLLVQDENTLLEIENSNILPDGGEQESLYAQNKSLFEKGDFEKVKDSLLLNLQNYFNGLTSKYEINMRDIDSVYSHLKSNKALLSHNVAFIFLVGDDLIRSNPEKKLRWGLIQEKVKLNPERKLVLLISNDQYFDLESRIFGKNGYQGYNYIKFSLPRFSVSTQPPLITIYKVWN